MTLFRGLVRNATKGTSFFGNNTLVVGKIWWQGRKIGSWGPGTGPSWGEYRSGGTGGSHPGIKVSDLPLDVRPISHSLLGLREGGKEARRGESG